MRFLDLVKRVKLPLTRIISKLQSKVITGSFYGYDDITLKLYLEIASTGAVYKLRRSGKVNLEKCGEVWEDIIKLNAEKNKDFQYSTFIEMRKDLTLLVSQYVIVKAFLTKCMITSKDKEAIKYLRRKGYNIIDDKDTAAYEQSLINALRRSDNLVTKAKMKENELKGFLVNNGNSKATQTGLEELLGHLSAGLGYSVDESLTLSRYNIYKDILKAKNGRQRSNRS